MRISRLLIPAISLIAISFTQASRADAVWAIAGKQVLRLSASIGGLSPEKRVEMIDERVNEFLSKGDTTLSAADITIKENGGTFTVLVRGDVLVTATGKDAVAQHTTSEKLARTWLTAIRNTLPQLAPRVNKRGA